MVLFAYDIYSGYIEDTLDVIGSRDMTLVERFQRLGDYTQQSLGLFDEYMTGLSDSIEEIIMNPPKPMSERSQAVAMLAVMMDAGKRRFRIITEGRQDQIMRPSFELLGCPDYNADFIQSEIAGFVSPVPEIGWGFLDVNQVKQLLLNAFKNESFMEQKTAAIAARLSHMSRMEAEEALVDVGIETQSSISHNINYLIIGSKGTGGTKFEKVQSLQNSGKNITVLDEAGFDELLRSPLPPPSDWRQEDKDHYEDLVRSLRHVWAFDLDLYCLSYVYNPEIEGF